MTGSALFDFLIAVIALVAIVTLIFYAMDKIAPDETFKKIARVAVGVVALIAFLVACKNVFFGSGGGALNTGGVQLIEFAIGLIVLMVVWYIVSIVIDFFGFWPVELKYVLGAIVLIVLLVLAERALFGGGLGFIPAGTFNTRRGAILDLTSIG
jgi:hypothetical protein